MDSGSETQEEKERGRLPTEHCALGYRHQDLKPGYLTSAAFVWKLDQNSNIPPGLLPLLC